MAELSPEFIATAKRMGVPLPPRHRRSFLGRWLSIDWTGALTAQPETYDHFPLRYVLNIQGKPMVIHAKPLPPRPVVVRAVTTGVRINGPVLVGQRGADPDLRAVNDELFAYVQSKRKRRRFGR